MKNFEISKIYENIILIGQIHWLLKLAVIEISKPLKSFMKLAFFSFKNIDVFLSLLIENTCFQINSRQASVRFNDS